MTKKISGLIITFNEENNIEEVLKCFHFVDEIIVIDSFSTDQTVQIAKRNPKVKIYQNKFDNFTEQRNLAIEKAQHNWLLFLDADERLTPKLELEILETINNPKAKDAYYFYRLFYFCKKPIRFSGTQNDKNFRLFKKDKAHFSTSKLVHEFLDVNGEIGVFKNKLLHYSFDDYEVYKEKMLHYAKLKARELHLKGVKYSFLIQISKSGFKFFKSFILKLGFLDAKNGFDLCYLQSLSTYKTYCFLKDLKSKS